MKKIIIILIAVLLVGGGVYFLYNKNQAKAPAEDLNALKSQDQSAQNSSDQQNPVPAPAGQLNTKTNTSSPSAMPKQFSSGEGESAGPDIQVWEVDFDGTTFTPSTVNIKVNDYVIFKNTGTVDFWVASNPHPTHTDYPGFDSKKNISAGGKYQFQFTKAGSWGYHDHLDPSISGTVVVAK